MRFFLSAAILGCIPVGVLAQNAIVRSGEHVGFTRLVAPIPSGAEWSVVQTNREVKFESSDIATEFDVSDVFNLIPRDRVSSIVANEDGFVIQLACDCNVSPFLATDGFIAIDIASPGVTRPFPFVPVQQDVAEAEVIEVDQRTEEELPTPLQPNIVAKAKPTIELPITIQPEPLELTQQPVPLGIPDLARTPLSEKEQQSLTDVQEQLARELGIAATRGLLTPKPGVNLPSFARPQIDTSVLEAESAAVPTEVEDDQTNPNNNLRITSSLDFPRVSIPANVEQTLTGVTCPADVEFDISDWADDRTFDQQTGEARLTLYGEFDRLNHDAAKNLAQMYVHFGFGAEALQILALDPELAAQEAWIRDIAQIMETGHAPDGSLLPGLLDCDTDASLWAILALNDIAGISNIDASAALRALDKLPLHLRKFLAPALSRKLLSLGNADAATLALRNLQRRSDTLPHTAKLAQAEIAIDEGDIEQATDGLQDVVDDNAEQSPEALIALVQTQLDDGQPIDPDTAGLVEAYAKELRDSEWGPGLRRAHVLALARSLQFDSAFEAMEELGGVSEEEEAVALRLRLTEELTDAAADVVFLDHIFDLPMQDIKRLPHRSVFRISSRLFDLGFAKQAKNVAETIPANPLHEPRQMLIARAGIALEQPQQVLAALQDMTGDEVDLLRAQAKQIAGDHAEAHAIFQRVNRSEDAEQSAWLAEEWVTLTATDSPIFGPIVNLSETEISPSGSSNGMLARSSDALAESETARQILLDLLNAPELDIESTETSE
ncbi:MAG: hypothetical protein ABJL67_19035 [Sulfitobacter sp.]